MQTAGNSPFNKTGGHHGSTGDTRDGHFPGQGVALHPVLVLISSLIPRQKE